MMQTKTMQYVVYIEIVLFNIFRKAQNQTER